MEGVRGNDFYSGEEFYHALLSGDELYCPELEALVFLYDNSGAIAHCNVSEDEAAALAKDSTRFHKPWSELTENPITIYEDKKSDCYNERDVSNDEFCEEYFLFDWYSTDGYITKGVPNNA